MNKIKSLGIMVLFVISLLAVSGIASALSIDSVKINGDTLSTTATNYIERDDEYDVKVTIESGDNESYEDAQIRVYLSGVDEDYSVEDSTDSFPIEEDTQYVKKLKLKLPHRLEKDDYVLYVRVENRDGQIKETEEDYKLKVRSVKNAIEIRRIILSPENNVKAGRALLAAVRIKNRGEVEEEDMEVKVSIPELGISATDYIDELDAECGDDDDCDDSTTSEELYLRIPDCAEPGEYTVKACVEYDDGDEEECETVSIEIVEGDICPITTPTIPAIEAKTIITIGPETQDVAAGQSVAYSVTLTNQGLESKSYSIAADAAWAAISITPTNVIVLGPGESKSVFVNVAASASATPGDQMFSVTISSKDKVLKQVPLKANVVRASAAAGVSSIKRGLEIGLIILVVLLVLLGLIIGFNKLRSSGTEGEEKEETYY